MTAFLFTLIAAYLSSVISCYCTLLYLSRKNKVDMSRDFSICFIPVINLLPFIFELVFTPLRNVINKVFKAAKENLNGRK